jgi:hypothetical protein
MAAGTGTDEILAWEARQRPRAAIAATIGAVTILAAAIFSGIIFGDAPRAWFGESVARTAAPGPLGQQPSLAVPFYEFYDDHANLVLLGSLIRAVGWLATGWALYVLAGATISRRPELPKAGAYLPLFAGALSALSTLVVDFASKIAVDDFLAGPRTVAAAQDVTATGVLVFGQFLGLGGSLAAATAFVLIGLNAMRAGLLTRFMGVLAIIVGVLLIFPIGSPIPIVQCFWLAALALLFLGRWPGGEPPAWRTGQAQPWPSAAQIREERMRAAGGTPAPAPAPEPATVPAGQGPHAAGPRRRKRKRRS